MKQYIIIVVAIAIIVLLNLCQVNYLSKTSRYMLTDINDVANCVEREDFEAALKGVYELENTWNSIRYGWDIFGEHNDIEEINKHIQSMKVYAKYQDKEELVNEYALLENAINHIIDTEKINFGNVL